MKVDMGYVNEFMNQENPGVKLAYAFNNAFDEIEEADDQGEALNRLLYKYKDKSKKMKVVSETMLALCGFPLESLITDAKDKY